MSTSKVTFLSFTLVSSCVLEYMDIVKQIFVLENV